MHNPKVSIVLPTYNGEKYIVESIQSVIDQTMPDWELIIVDDCSTDKTPDIIEQYVLQDSRISCIRNKVNQKLPKSLNIGFDNVSGKYLTWTSDDNYYARDALAIMVDELENNRQVDMVYTGMTYVDDNNSFLQKVSAMDIAKLPFVNAIGACFMYRKEVMQQIGNYDEHLFLVEDYDYWLRIYEKNKVVRAINKELYFYRCHSDSLTGTKSRQIKNQVFKLRIKHRDRLFEMINSDINKMVKFYYEAKRNDYLSDVIKNNVLISFPILKREISNLEDYSKYIIFGAGSMGDEALNILGDKAVAFIDNNDRLVGSIKNGLEILRLESALERYKDIPILLAVSTDKIYELLCQIEEKSVDKFGTIYGLKKDSVK